MKAEDISQDNLERSIGICGDQYMCLVCDRINMIKEGMVVGGFRD